jgi:RNAse (barnase) inhibitor barstar
MASLLKLLPNSKRAGVYQTAIAAGEIVAAAKTVGLDVFKLDLGGARGKSGLLDRFAKALRFPAHFGKNLDALNDCLTDLEWLDGKGWVVIVANAQSFADKYEEDFTTAIDILTGAAEHWRKRKKPFWIIVQAQAGWELKLPKLVIE